MRSPRRRRWRALQVFVALAASVLLMTVPASAVSLDPEIAVPLHPEFLSAFGVDLAANGEEVRLVSGGQLAGPFGFDWSYAASHDGGRTFTAGRSPFPDSMGGLPTVRVVALADGSFAYLWAPPGGTLSIAVEQPDGTWRGVFQPIVATTIGEGFDVRPAGTDLMVAWTDEVPGNGELRVGSFTGPAFFLASWITLDADAAWLKRDLRVRLQPGEDPDTFVAWRRTNPNATMAMFAAVRFPSSFPGPTRVSGSLAPFEFSPDLAVEGGRAFVSFWDPTGNRSSLRGAIAVPPYLTFTEFDLGARVGASIPDAAALGVDSQGRLLVAWLDGDPVTQTGGFRVMVSESQDWDTFSFGVRVDGDPTQFVKDGPAIEVDGARVFVAWGDRRDGTGTPTPYLVSTPTSIRLPVIGFVALGVSVAVAAVAILVVLALHRKRAPASAPAGTPAAAIAAPAQSPASFSMGRAPCPRCGTLNEAPFPYCISCGSPLGPPPPAGPRS